MKIKEIKEVINLARQIDEPLMLWGPPGVGKSQAVHQIAQEEGIQMVDIRAALTEQGDWAGLPYTAKGATGEEFMKFHITPLLPHDPKWKGIIFLDEINRAPREVLNCIFQLILDRKIQNYYTLPKGAYIVSAGNPPDENEPISEMGRALLSRFTHIQVEPTLEEYLEYSSKSKESNTVRSFLKQNSKYLSPVESTFDFKLLEPNLRSWSRVSKFENLLKKNNKFEQYGSEIISGIVGSTAATQFITFATVGYKKIDLDRVFSNYEKERNNVLNLVESGDLPAQKEVVESIFSKETKYGKMIMEDEENLYTAGILISDLSPDIQYCAMSAMLKLAAATKMTWDQHSKLFANKHPNVKLQEVFTKIIDTVLKFDNPPEISVGNKEKQDNSEQDSEEK